MSRLLLRILFAAILAPVALSLGQTPTQAPTAQASASIGPAKLAWINLEQAIMTCDEGAKQLTDIQKYVDAKNSELEALKKEFEGLKNQLNMQGAKLNDDARAELEDKIETKDTALQRFQQDTQKDINARKDRITNYIGRKMIPVIEAYAKEKGLSAVLFLNPNRDAFVDQSLIVTEDIIKAYNRKNPVVTPKAPAK